MNNIDNIDTRAMTAQDHKQYWLEKVRDNSDDLRDLIRYYHPSAGRCVTRPSMPITAPNAEAACAVVRNQIATEQPSDPVLRFNAAVERGDVGEIMSLLEGAWFGVPESTACWNVRGFSVAVDLLDDPPSAEED